MTYVVVSLFFFRKMFSPLFFFLICITYTTQQSNVRKNENEKQKNVERNAYLLLRRFLTATTEPSIKFPLNTIPYPPSPITFPSANPCVAVSSSLRLYQRPHPMFGDSTDGLSSSFDSFFFGSSSSTSSIFSSRVFTSTISFDTSGIAPELCFTRIFRFFELRRKQRRIRSTAATNIITRTRIRA